MLFGYEKKKNHKTFKIDLGIHLNIKPIIIYSLIIIVYKYVQKYNIEIIIIISIRYRIYRKYGIFIR